MLSNPGYSHAGPDPQNHALTVHEKIMRHLKVASVTNAMDVIRTRQLNLFIEINYSNTSCKFCRSPLAILVQSVDYNQKSDL